MNVEQLCLKLEHIDQCISNLRSGKMLDTSLLADLLQEYYDILNSLPVRFTKETNE